MKRTLVIFFSLFLFIGGVFFASCSNVTETGNPLPTAEPSLSGGNVYNNEIYGVTIIYPAEWTYEEAPDGTEVIFEGRDADITGARVLFKELRPVPNSLYAYLAETYPDREFSHYATMTLAGYMYDDPAEGPNGGDIREYYFSNDDLLVQVVAEMSSWGKVEIGALLNGISFHN